MLSYSPMEIKFIFSLAVIIISIVIHELSHGYTAYFLGDPTAKYAGRLTLNPLKHMELFGSVIVPIITFFLGGIVFGWAKPVPFNPYNLHTKKWGEAIVAVAGPLSNLAIAIVFGIVARIIGPIAFSSSSLYIIPLIILTNITLAVFNLIPLPPLDGSKILFSVFPEGALRLRGTFERYGIFVIILFILFAGMIISPIINTIFYIITGVPIA